MVADKSPPSESHGSGPAVIDRRYSVHSASKEFRGATIESTHDSIWGFPRKRDYSTISAIVTCVCRREKMATSDRIRILAVDDHAMFRQGVAAVIRHQPDMLLVAEASTAGEAIQRFREHTPDVTLMDLRLPHMSGIDAMIAIRSEFPDARIIILTTFVGDIEIQRALEAGARGYLRKSMPPQELLEVIRQVHEGKKRIPPEIATHLAEHYSDEGLTEREIEVLGQIADGTRNRDIAEKLFISELTVKVHIKHLMQKLGATNRTQAFAIGLRRGIIGL